MLSKLGKTVFFCFQSLRSHSRKSRLTKREIVCFYRFLGSILVHFRLIIHCTNSLIIQIFYRICQNFCSQFVLFMIQKYLKVQKFHLNNYTFLEKIQLILSCQGRNSGTELTLPEDLVTLNLEPSTEGQTLSHILAPCLV